MCTFLCSEDLKIVILFLFGFKIELFHIQICYTQNKLFADPDYK